VREYSGGVNKGPKGKARLIPAGRVVRPEARRSDSDVYERTRACSQEPRGAYKQAMQAHQHAHLGLAQTCSSADHLSRSKPEKCSIQNQGFQPTAEQVPPPHAIRLGSGIGRRVAVDRRSVFRFIAPMHQCNSLCSTAAQYPAAPSEDLVGLLGLTGDHWGPLGGNGVHGVGQRCGARKWASSRARYLGGVRLLAANPTSPHSPGGDNLNPMRSARVVGR
jgi:hypothetical protein